MRPDHIHFPVLPGQPSNLVTSPKQKKKKIAKSNLCCPYPHLIKVKLPVASPLKKTEFFPTYTPARSHYLGEQHQRVLFNGFLSRLFLFGWGGEVRVGVVAEAFYAPLSQRQVCSH